MARVLRRRTGLPSGRALAGALLVTVAGLGTYLVAATDTTSYPSFLVVARTVDPGATLRAEDLHARPLGLTGPVADGALTRVEQAVGTVALVPLAPGQLLHEGHLGHPDTGEHGRPVHELTFPVAGDRVPPGLRRGEQVAVLATVGVGPDARTEVAVTRALVLGLDRGGDALVARPGVRLTLALDDPATVVSTAHAAHTAELTIVRATGVASDVSDHDYHGEDEVQVEPGAGPEHDPTGGTATTEGDRR